jgi:hypothetical protein
MALHQITEPGRVGRINRAKFMNQGQVRCAAFLHGHNEPLAHNLVFGDAFEQLGLQ